MYTHVHTQSNFVPKTAVIVAAKINKVNLARQCFGCALPLPTPLQSFFFFPLPRPLLPD